MRKILLVIVLLMPIVANADTTEVWQSGFGQGIFEYSVRNGPGNEFVISCNYGGAGDMFRKSNIYISIIGRLPPPNSPVKIILDGEEYQVYASKQGVISTDCHACADNFIHMWPRLRSAHSMLVQFEDGRSSQFTTRGSSKTLDEKPCPTDFYD